MANESDLKELYEHKLRPALENLEKDRRKSKLLNKLVIGYIIFMVVSWIPLPMFFIRATPYFVAFHIITLITLFVLSYTKRAAYDKKYKKQVIENVLNLVRPDWQLFPEQSVEKEEFQQSKLLRVRYACYRGDDLITGNFNGLPIQFSEIYLGTKTGDNNKGCYDPSFQGLFLILNFEHTFPEHIIVSPLKEDGSFTPLYEEDNKWFSKPKEIAPVKPPISDFDNHFVAHSLPANNPEATLTQSIKDALVEIKQTYQCELHLSFTGNKVHCVVSKEMKGLFEPNLKESGVQYANIKEAYDYFIMIEAIIKALDSSIRV